MVAPAAFWKCLFGTPFIMMMMMIRGGREWFGWEVGWDDPIRWQPDAKKWIIRLSSRRLYFNANHLIFWMKKNLHFNLMVLIYVYVGAKVAADQLTKPCLSEMLLVNFSLWKDTTWILGLNWAHWNLFPAVFTSTIYIHSSPGYKM